MFSFVSTGILFTGLWPFNFFQKNTAEWVPEKGGVSLEPYSIVYGREVFGPELFQGTGTTIELVIRPERETYAGLQKILSFYDPVNRSEEFVVAQWISHLILMKRDDASQKSDVYIEKAGRYLLPVDSTIFLTFSTDGKNTAVYMNGELKKNIRNFTFLTSSELTGKKPVIGNSISGTSSWTGKILKFSIYDTVFDIKSVKDHYDKWAGRDHDPVLNTPVCCYEFDEGEGNLIKDRCGSGCDLLIPSRFKTLHKQILTTAGAFFRKNRSNILDVFLNILGYIPLGFFFALTVIETGSGSKRSVYVSSVMAGFILSLIVELLQVFLPSRDSSLQDLLFNTVGTAGGVILLHFSMLFERPFQVFGRKG